MSKRELDSRLEELKEQGIPIYSISRLDTINNCLYEAYHTYVLEDRGKDNVYSALGGAIHDCLEEIVNGTKTEADLNEALKDELENLEILGLEFPKDFKGEDSIRDGWIANMKHFCNNYKSPRGDLTTEELFLYQTPKGYWLQGYIDLYHTRKDDSIDIYDYKTSSMYKNEDLKEHQRQLILYVLGKEQEGYKVNKASWIFLKYVNVEYLGYKTTRAKEKTEVTKTFERRKVGSEMAKYIEKDLDDNGFDEIDIDVILHELKKTNTFDCLPDCIRDNYKMKPCVVEAEITEETKQECIDYIENTIEMWEGLDSDSKKNYPPRKFTKTNNKGEEKPDCFFCTNLCGHFEKCEYVHDYLDTLNDGNGEDDDDLF